MRSLEPLTEAPDLEYSSAEEVLAYIVDRFHPRLYVACSFQKEASVIMDMLLQIEPEARFFTLDTGLLFPETYDTWRRLEKRYGVKVDVYQGMSLARQRRCTATSSGRDAGRLLRHPQGRAAERGARRACDAWVAGLRRDQSPSRATTAKFHWDAKHDLWKANPLADWTEKDVWNYIVANDVPYNQLHDRGYSSIGCTHCTLPERGPRRALGRHRQDRVRTARMRSRAAGRGPRESWIP